MNRSQQGFVNQDGVVASSGSSSLATSNFNSLESLDLMDSMGSMDELNKSESVSELEEEYFEIRDFSTLSSWEKLVDDMEQVIMIWLNWVSKQDPSSSEFHHKRHTLHYNGSKYTLLYYNFHKPLEDSFPHRSHHLTRWYGIQEFFILSSTHELEKQMTTTLLSALSIALSCHDIPFFVLQNEPYKHYFGRRQQTGKQVTRYKSETLQIQQGKYLASLYTKLTGLIDLFCINIGKYVRISNELLIQSRYTHVLRQVNNQEWNGLKYGHGRGGKLFIGSTQDPIHSIQIAFDFHRVDMNGADLDELDVGKADGWDVRRISQPVELQRVDSLRHFIKDIYVPFQNKKDLFIQMNEASPPLENRQDPSLYLKELILDIFSTEEEDEPSPIAPDERPNKSCPPTSLLRRFSERLTLLRSPNDLPLFWRLFIRVLFKYWEESMGQDVETVELLSEADIQSSFIPFTRGKGVDWGCCLLEQKICMLNLCCMREWERVVAEKKREEWGDGFPIDGDDLGIVEVREGDGRRVVIPVTQGEPPKTEDLIEEEVEMLSNMTSSKQRMRFQCEGLISDIQVFKYYNPEAEFSDFLSWYSPKDVDKTSHAISTRMNVDSDENVWKLFWDECEPLPIEKQKQRFDHKLQAERVIHYLETVDLHSILDDLLICTLVSSYYALKEWWFDLTGLTEEEIRKVPFLTQTQLHLDQLRSQLKKINSTSTSMDQLMSLLDAFTQVELSISLTCSLLSKIQPATSKKNTGVKSVDGMVWNVLDGLMRSEEVMEFTNSGDNGDNGLEVMRQLVCERAVDAREYILKCRAQRPYLLSAPTDQLMYALVSQNEIRIATALTEKVPW